MAVALLGAGFPVHAQTSAVSDSLKVINLQEVQVVSTRATAKTPVAFTNIGLLPHSPPRMRGRESVIRHFVYAERMAHVSTSPSMVSP